MLGLDNPELAIADLSGWDTVETDTDGNSINPEIFSDLVDLIENHK